jgi:hypothetical protein
MLLVCLGAGACAGSREVVRMDDAAFRRLPEPDQQAALSREDKERAAAQEEKRAQAGAVVQARTQLDDARKDEHQAAATTRRARSQLDLARGDAQREMEARHDLEVAGEGEKVQTAKAAWLSARLRWSVELDHAADLRLAAADAGRELAKAEAVARRGNDPVDVAPFRGQYARLHKEWSDARAQAVTVRGEVGRAEQELAAAKARFAAARSMPAEVSVAPAPAR